MNQQYIELLLLTNHGLKQPSTRYVYLNPMVGFVLILLTNGLKSTQHKGLA